MTITQLLSDLHTLLGCGVHLYDAQQRALLHFGNPQGLCMLIHTASDTKSACLAFDERCFREAAARGDVFVSDCPFGIYTAIAPIYDTDRLIGFLQLDCVIRDEAACIDTVRERALAVLPRSAERVEARLALFAKVTGNRLDAYPSILRAACALIESKALFPQDDITLGVLTKRYIKHNLQSKLSLADICRHLHCSKATLTETFRREFGITIVQYVNRMRLERACNLLVNSDLSVRAIAEECGFSGTEYFSSLFKKARGCSPLAYRHSTKQGGDPDAK